MTQCLQQISESTASVLEAGKETESTVESSEKLNIGTRVESSDEPEIGARVESSKEPDIAAIVEEN